MQVRAFEIVLNELLSMALLFVAHGLHERPFVEMNFSAIERVMVDTP